VKDILAVVQLKMKQYIGMIEVLGEGGELQPLHWNPSHLVQGRSILVVDEPEAIVWVWLGQGTSMLQRTTALRQARFIMKNGIHVEEIHFGTKCTNFIEIPGDLKSSKASLLKKLLETHAKTSDYLVVVEEEAPISTFDDLIQDRVEVFEQAIVPEPTRQVTRARRRILTYEEQLATKVLFAVSDCYGQATMIPIGPSEFQVSVLRLQLRFICQGDEILFTAIHATAPEDLEAFTRCFGQVPQLTADGQQTVGTAPDAAPEVVDVTEQESVFESMREQLSQLTNEPGSPEEGEVAQDKTESEEEKKGGSTDFELFS
jgi:hypothetical protein